MELKIRAVPKRTIRAKVDRHVQNLGNGKTSGNLCVSSWLPHTQRLVGSYLVDSLTTKNKRNNQHDNTVTFAIAQAFYTTRA